MAFIIDQDQQQNLQQVVAPAAPVASPVTLSPAQFTKILGWIRGADSSSLYTQGWLEKLADESVPQFDALRQQIKTKFETIFGLTKFANPEDIAKLMAGSISWNPSEPTYALVFGMPSKTPAEIEKRNEAMATAGVAQGFDAAVIKILDDKITESMLPNTRTPLGDLRDNLLARAKAEVAKTNIDLNDPTTLTIVQSRIYDNFNDPFKSSTFGWADFDATISLIPSLWVADFSGLCINGQTWNAELDNIINANTVAAQKINDFILDTKLYLAQTEIAALTKSDSFDFTKLKEIQDVQKTGNIANTIAVIEKNLYSNGANSIKNILDKYGINNNLAITMAVTDGVDALHKNLELHLLYNNNPITHAPHELLNGVFTAELKIPAIQQAREALKNFINQVSIDQSHQVLHEDRLIATHLFTGAGQTLAERIKAINAGFAWQEISKEDFKILTGCDLSLITQPQLDYGKEGKFDFKLFVRKSDTGVLEYTAILTGDSIPATESTPNTRNENFIQSTALKNGNKFESYQQVISKVLQSHGITYKNNLWLEQLLNRERNGYVESVTDSTFINQYTNYQDVFNAIHEALKAAGVQDQDFTSRWAFDHQALTRDANPYSGKFNFGFTITDSILSTVLRPNNQLGRPLAFAEHTLADGSKIYSVLDPLHSTQYSKDISLIEAPDQLPFSKPVVGGVFSYGDLLWNDQKFQDLITSLKARGVIFVDDSSATSPTFVDFTLEKATYSYRLSPDEPRIGGVFTFKTVGLNAVTGASEETTISVFVVLEAKPATQAEKDAAIKEVEDRAKDANDAISLAISLGQKIDNVDQLRLKIQGIVNKFKETVNAGEITEPKLNTLKIKAINDIEKLLDDAKLITVVDINALLQKLAPILYPHLGTDAAIAALMGDSKMMDIIRKYPGVIQKLLNIHPPLSKDVFEFVLKNKNLLEMLSNFIESTPENIINKVVKGITVTSDNYQYGYFGAGAALGLAGLGGAAATVGTVRAAKKAKKVTTHKIKIRSNKLISFITGGISLLAMGGSAALLILFFMKQGGF